MKRKFAIYKVAYDKYVASLDRVAAKTRTPVISLDELIREPVHRTIFTDTMHINREGAERYGVHIAEALRAEVASALSRKR